MNTCFLNYRNFVMRPAGIIERRGAILRFRKYRVQLWNVTMLTPPPMFQDDDGRVWTTGKDIRATDLGSIPIDLVPIAGSTSSHPLPFIFHDVICRTGGLYLCERHTNGGVAGCRKYVSYGEQFITIPRGYGDGMLYRMILADDGSRYNALKIWFGASQGTLFRSRRKKQ